MGEKSFFVKLFYKLCPCAKYQKLDKSLTEEKKAEFRKKNEEKPKSTVFRKLGNILLKKSAEYKNATLQCTENQIAEILPPKNFSSPEKCKHVEFENRENRVTEIAFPKNIYFSPEKFQNIEIENGENRVAEIASPQNISYSPKKFKHLKIKNVDEMDIIFVDASGFIIRPKEHCQNLENMQFFTPEPSYSVPQFHSRTTCHDMLFLKNVFIPENTNEAPNEERYWGKIAYYELNQRVGPLFPCRGKSVKIIGQVDLIVKKNETFCIADLPSFHCKQNVSSTRNFIGRGIELLKVKSDVYLKRQSTNAVFVNSTIFNFMHKMHYGTVCKIEPGETMKVFDFGIFKKLVACYRRNYGYEMMEQLSKLCTIRVSLVKGWGPKYRRREITSTPCWLEIHFYEALEYLEIALTDVRIVRRQFSTNQIKPGVSVN